MIIEHNLKEEFTCSGEYIIIYLILNSVQILCCGICVYMLVQKHAGAV